MKRAQNLVCIVLFIILVLSIKSNVVFADSTQTQLSQYALSWADCQEIKYVYGGDRTNSLEYMKEHKIGTDCSGFVSRVYDHFGIKIPTNSSAIFAKAVKKFQNEEEAVPGDICWWEGHVAIYIGDGKIVHTNTKKPPVNYIHVSIFRGEGKNYRAPTYYLRYVEDTSQLGAIQNTADAPTAVEDAQKKVETAEGKGTLITESDLNGVTIEETLSMYREWVELGVIEDLSLKEQKEVANMKESISTKMEDSSPRAWYQYAQSCIGLLCVVDGVVLILAYLFDYVNTFLEINFLGIMSFGRFKLVNKEDIENGMKAGRVKEDGYTYVTFGMLMIRVIVVISVGCFLISGALGDLLSWVISTIFY